MPNSSHNGGCSDLYYVKNVPYAALPAECGEIAPFRVVLVTLRGLERQPNDESETTLQSHIHEPGTGL